MDQHVRKTDDRIERRAKFIADRSKQAPLAESLGFKFRLQRTYFIQKLLLFFERASDKSDRVVYTHTFHAIGAENQIAGFD